MTLLLAGAATVVLLINLLDDVQFALFTGAHWMFTRAVIVFVVPVTTIWVLYTRIP